MTSIVCSIQYYLKGTQERVKSVCGRPYILYTPEGEGGLLLLRSLSSFINLVLAGEVAPLARPFFFGASLIALTKKDGGVRPITVGCTLRRLAAK